MALYDFKCEKCECMFEVERPIAATGPAKCPACGSTNTSKIFSAAGIVFKGGGFYVNDSKAHAGAGSSRSGKPGADKASGEAGTDKPSADKPASSDAPTTSDSSCSSDKKEAPATKVDDK
ncbi:MAG: zinc ribbon domain-containing protein [bacterium]|nr:zinc ribbon domain-containing protein [bacterium]